jgi:hypothetical protein
MSSDRVAYLRRRPWHDLEPAPGVVGVPSMLSKVERRLLYALARDYAADDAAIVDAGCFLGGSTAALLAGVRDRPEPWRGPPVASYDMFRVEPYMTEKFFAEDETAELGDSFRDRFDANVAGFDVPHVVYEGDITKIGWSGGPIGVLFLDVLKSWEINDAVLRDFFPSLVPGRSVIVHQDYGWGSNPWIPITVELMRGALDLIDWMEWGSHVFLLERELPADLLENGVSGLDPATRLEVIDRAVARSEGWPRGILEINRTILVAERDGNEAALTELASIADRYREYGFVQSCVADVRKDLGGEAEVAEADGDVGLKTRLAGMRTRLTRAARGVG